MENGVPSPQAALVWLRDDLRLDDQPAIAAAGSAPTLFVYVFDETTPGPRSLGGASKWYLGRSLAAFAKRITAFGGRLDVLVGASEPLLLDLVRAGRVTSAFWTRRYGGGEIALDRRIKAALRAQGVEARSFNGQLLREPWEVRTGKGDRYSVFTPFWRAHLALGAPPAPLPAPKKLVAAPWPDGAPPRVEIADLGLHPTKPDWSAGLAKTWTPGEAGAQTRLKAFIDGPVADYADGRNRLDLDYASNLSPHLRFGEISPHRIGAALEAAVAGGGAQARQSDAFMREIGWRDFSYAQLLADPELATRPYKPAFSAFPFRDDPGALDAWQKGMTGYPVVDAAMRQLWRTGTMHNRARMIVASFLVKHLLVDWRVGEAWFWDTLCDADPANNPASWQWVMGSGADAAPYFRIFNPVLQGQKFDPDGAYVRRWVPELANALAAWIHAPWLASPVERASAGLALGRDYPLPIVDHGAARARALKALAAIRADRGDEGRDHDA